MNILVVHAHHESQSFTSSLKNTLVECFRQQGHQVVESDLYAMAFDPVSDRRNFISSKNERYLKQAAEELEGHRTGAYLPELENEMRKIEACDLMVLSFPLWWMSMPAIMKGWFDRVFTAGRMWSNTNRFENGIGAAEKKALILLTTGESEPQLSNGDLFPSLTQILRPLQQGVLWRHGFLSLAPFVTFAPDQLSSEERVQELTRLRLRASGLSKEPVVRFVKETECDEAGSEKARKFMLTFRRSVGITDSELLELTKSLPASINSGSKPRIISWRATSPSSSSSSTWRLFIEAAAAEKCDLLNWQRTHPTLKKLPLEVHELTPPEQATSKGKRNHAVHVVKVTQLAVPGSRAVLPTSIAANAVAKATSSSKQTSKVTSGSTPQLAELVKNKRALSLGSSLVHVAARSYYLAPLLSIFRKDM